MKPVTKYKGSIKLAAIGDALGWITEFEKSTDSLKTKYKTEYISNFYEWKKSVGGRFNGYVDYLEKGSYSDDTQLLLSVARAIKTDGSVDHDYFSKIELPNWLLYSRGAGRTIKNAARKIVRKSAKWNQNFFSFKAGKVIVDYRESGANGAAMRILPIALANFGDIDKIKEEIFANSIVTHGHPRAIIGAILYGYSIDTILKFRPENFTYETFLTELGKGIHNKLSIPFLDKPRFKAWESEWDKKAKYPFRELFTLTLDETQQYLRDAYKLLTNKSKDNIALEKLGCFNPDTKGSGISTVIAGIYFCCKYLHEPIKAIEQAVNSIGTDTDSIAAFAGGLVGALHGDNIIPGRFNKVQDFDYLEKVAIRLLEISEGRAKPNKIPVNNNIKSINNIGSDDFVLGEHVYFEPLGFGTLKKIDRQNTLTRGKYNVILDVDFEIGQSCRFAKILNKTEVDYYPMSDIDDSKLYNFLKLDFKTKDRIDKFVESLNDTQTEEFMRIIFQIGHNFKS
ncbi:MAG: ADP-ribosylglycohydrolase family protein [Bacteroidetes bacterium]|nr:MAG: ADP-ribosylglycohydrolase family protein [Bacteroidota bacterium]